jgi:hypothetical protein
MNEDEDKIIKLMKECNIDYYIIKTMISDQDILFDIMYFHHRGDTVNILSTANEYESPMFEKFKELELLVMGETS